MKQDDYSWGGGDEGEKVINNLYALALLTSLHGPLSEEYTQALQYFVDEAETGYVSDKRFLLPFVLGLYVILKQLDNQSFKVRTKLDSILIKGEKETKRLSFAVEYLFSVAFFCDLLESEAEENNMKSLISRASEFAMKVSDSFENISDSETKVKLLYSLAALRLDDRLNSLYEGSKIEIEGLVENIKSEDIKALLLRPYMVLGIRCNRQIVFDLKDYFRENKFGVEERNIRQRLSHFFLYTGNKRNLGIGIEQTESNSYRLSLDLSEESALALQRQIPAIPFVCKVALSLANCGFRCVYTVPTQEMEQYREF